MYTHLGPSYWTENRTDDIITDIDIIIKGWHDVSEVPTFIKHVHLFDEENDMVSTGTTAMELPNHMQDGLVEKTFNWIVPENLRTDATWHNNVHPHDVDNDKKYQEKFNQWLPLILESDEYKNTLELIRTELEEL